MTDNQKTELEEAIEDLDGLMDFAQPETSETANQVQILVNAAKKYAALSDYILIRRDDVPDGLSDATYAFFDMYAGADKNGELKTYEAARLVQAAMEDK